MIIKDRFQIQERYVHINIPSRMCAFNEAIDNYIVDVQCHFLVFFFFYQKREDFGEIKLICRGIDKKNSLTEGMGILLHQDVNFS